MLPSPSELTGCPVRARVLIVQEVVPHYRLKLFELLYKLLRQNGVELQVIYGNPNKEQAAKRDLVDLPPPIGLTIRNYWLCGGKLLYQPIFRRLLSVDLVIIPNANKHIWNVPLSVASRLKRLRLGIWVFQESSQIVERSFREIMRVQITRAGRWWFAYTATTRDYLLSRGIPCERITVLNNSVNLSDFRAKLSSVTSDELRDFAARHDVPTDAPIGLFCGGLYRNKRLQFLFEAVRLIHLKCPDFHFFVLGDGTMRDVVLQAAAKDRRIHYLGASFGKEKAMCFQLSQVFVCPGIVGLAILDAFAAGLPMITTDIPIHSPEIEYLSNGVNGLLTSDDPKAYAEAIIALFESKSRLHLLSRGAIDSAREYSTENMAKRFAEGIVSSLNI